MEQDYSKRELDMKFDKLGQKVDDNHRETNEQISLLDRKIKDSHMEQIALLQEIKGQTMKTNGRVNKLEAWRTGLVMAGMVIVAIVIPLIVYIYTAQLQTVNTRLDTLRGIILSK